MVNEGSESKFIFLSNHRCLDFINTQIIQKGRLVDLLGDFSDLVEWLKRAEFLDSTESNKALERWSGRPEGERMLERTREVRTTLREMIQRVVKGKSVGQSAIDEINNMLKNRIGYTQVFRGREGFETRFHLEANEATHLIVPIAESASDLLCYSDFSLIKKCENPDCVLYFYDISKNHARRWCSMNICGNRMKVATHYRRHRNRKGQ